MSYRIVKGTIKNFTNRTFILPLKLTNGNFPNSYFAGRGCVFTLHKVVRTTRDLDPFNRFIEITKDHLERTIQYLNRKKYYFATLDELRYFIEHDAFPQQKVVHFSFDDGYLDNLTVANPIFEKYKVPYSIFITTGFPQRDMLMWWYLLSGVLSGNYKLSLPNYGLDCSLSSLSENQKVALFDKLANIIKFNSFKSPDLFHTFFMEHGIDPVGILERDTMSWDEIRQLHLVGLATIGVHTHQHYPLKCISDDEMQKEILYSKYLLEANLKAEMKFFSYPFGSPAEVSQREASFVQEKGFSMALGTNLGNIFSKQANSMFYLPRIFLNDQVNEYALNMRLNGLYPFISNNYARSYNPL